MRSTSTRVSRQSESSTPLRCAIRPGRSDRGGGEQEVGQQVEFLSSVKSQSRRQSERFRRRRLADELARLDAPRVSSKCLVDSIDQR
jgi:hypothetical protein